MSPSRYLDLQRDGDAEFSGWDRDVIRAFQEWEAGCCPGCGLPLGETQRMANRSATEQARFEAGYRECLACEWLERSQHAQQLVDDRDRERLGDDACIPTRHRLWYVRPAPEEVTDD